ncbi:MAG: FAD-binding oxidoreductase [Paracoccaceae bacterium]
MALNPVGPDLSSELATGLSRPPLRDVPPHYLQEPRGLFQGRAGLLVTPENTREVAHVVTACGRNHVGIVPFGGGTGLVGGQVCTNDPPPVILSLERMNRIRSLERADAVIVAEAGVVLEHVDDAAAKAGMMFGLSLASGGSCQIGGNLATNAGGIGVLRHGSARDLCLGLEAVLPDGSVWNGLSGLLKDNTGYDLKNLLIGSEGSLGVITAASLKLAPRPAEEVAVFACVRDVGAAIGMLALFRAQLGGLVSAFELIHRQGFAFLAEKLPQVRVPFAEPDEWMVLADIGGPAGAGVQRRLEAVLQTALKAGLVGNAVLSQNEAQRHAFWQVRESIPEANRLIGAISTHDISVRVSRIPDLINGARLAIEALGSDLRINCFGHLGDGNLHLNAYPPKGRAREEFRHLRQPLKDAVFDVVHGLGGSISAEHGIGRLKVADLERYGDPARLAAMRAIKAALDPLGIMNPGAVIG